MSKILFLDMDGVVNSAEWFNVISKRAYRRARGRAKAVGRSRGTFVHMIDPAAVRLLNVIVAGGWGTPAAKVVLSSSWRIPWTHRQVQGMLRERGFRGRLIDSTPKSVRPPPGQEHARGHEIQRWLDRHPSVESFVILDDADDMAHLCPRLVQTTWARGLEAAHVDAARTLLAVTREGRG